MICDALVNWWPESIGANIQQRATNERKQKRELVCAHRAFAVSLHACVWRFTVRGVFMMVHMRVRAHARRRNSLEWGMRARVHRKKDKNSSSQKPTSQQNAFVRSPASTSRTQAAHKYWVVDACACAGDAVVIYEEIRQFLASLACTPPSPPPPTSTPLCKHAQTYRAHTHTETHSPRTHIMRVSAYPRCTHHTHTRMWSF